MNVPRNKWQTRNRKQRHRTLQKFRASVNVRTGVLYARNLVKPLKITWPGVRVRKKMAGVQVRRKIISRRTV